VTQSEGAMDLRAFTRSFTTGRMGWKTLAVILPFLLIITLVVYFKIPILIGLADFLIIDQPVQTADAIVILNGEVETRPFYAAELYGRKMAPVVLIAQTESSPAEQLGLLPNTTDVAIDIMKKQGVPAENIIRIAPPGGVTSTHDETLALRHYIDAQSIRQIVVVTSAFHTRRAQWTFNRMSSGFPVAIRMAPSPHWGFDRTNWWRCEDGLISLCNEYIKLLYYLTVY